MSTFAGRDGLELHYREVGEGRPLILLHGFIANSAQWLDHGPGHELVARGFRLILPDMRGHGDSAHPRDPAAYPPDALVDDGLALIDQLGLADYDLGGYSLGGRVAVRMLVRGARPRRAVIAGQGLMVVTKQVSGETYRPALTALAHGDAIDPESSDAQLARWIGRSGADPQALLNVLDCLVPTPADALRQVETTTLVVVGQDDQRQASADELAALLPGARFVRVPGNHGTAVVAPEFAAAVSEFLTGRTGPGSARPA